MRRVMFPIMASVAIFAFVPASAMARKHHRRHHHHHARIHRFGEFTAPSSQGTAIPTPSSSQTAGTVTSFDPVTGVLVVTLSDGTTTETGTVTSDTEIECQAVDDESSTVGEDGDGGTSGGDNGGDQSGGGEDNGTDGGDDQGEEGGNQTCSTANLTTGAAVLGAELKITSAGAVWDTVELMS